MIQYPSRVENEKVNDEGMKVDQDSQAIAGFNSSLTSEHGLDATRMWQADRLHAGLNFVERRDLGLTPVGLQDSGGRNSCRLCRCFKAFLVS